MGIQSTQYITRDQAIRRILKIYSYVKQSDYLKIDKNSFEPDYDVDEFVNGTEKIKTELVYKWSNRMLEDKMDEPFFRYSMFDNYLIENKE